jgi:glucose/arabinose dehydrogenase
MRFKRVAPVLALIGLFLCSDPAFSQVTINEVLPPGSFNKPISIANAGDGSKRLFIVEQAGFIRIVKNGAVLSTPFLDVDALTNGGGERGLLNVAFPPNYENTGKFYIYYTATNGDVTIARYTVSGNPDVANPNGEVILTIPHQKFGNHNGGGMAFGPDGYLYLAVGDGGGGGDPDDNGQNKEKPLLGKILRLDVSGATG